MNFIGVLIFVSGVVLMAAAVLPELKRRLRDEETGHRVRAAIPPALRYPKYRAYWFGLLASVAGFRMFEFSQFWLAYELTGSPLYLGYVGVAQAVPGVVLNLFGGVFADRLDKRRLIIVTQVVTAGLIFFLATLTAFDLVNRWHVLIVAFLAGGVDAFNQPARQAIFPHLIDRRVMMSAVALNSTVWPGTAIVVPAIAGALIALADTEVALYVGATGFLAMAVIVSRLRIPPVMSAARGSPAQDMLEGLKFIVRNSIFSFLIAMTFFNSFFGVSYQIMMPVFAVDVLKVGAPGQGVLLGVRGVGALLTNLWWGSRTQVSHKGWLIIGGGMAFGLLLAAFSLTSQFVGFFPLALVLIFIMAVFNSTYTIAIQSSLQMMVPDQMRGRVMGFLGMTWSIMPMGGMYTGALAGLIGVPIAVATGGFAVSIFAVGPALINRKLRNLDRLLFESETTGARVRQAESPTPTASND